ncbi:hypothetical protein FHW83_004919 [Duganella sp. SG902]|uniref:DUF4351 domain-containing protein n=1 Tax=Duganella sp. SG902 TaxID=2587016 RepID=UPI00159E5F42|nr:DUF4351 domain-containing protein [Duganella sp. SG902]NVM79082.1 hypothetical protein [Duganella sp. SG902]
MTHAFRSFMDFYFCDFSARIDWRQRPRFRDKELARVSFGATPDIMVADKLVEVRLLDGSRQALLIHVEIQSQRDATLARRMRDYNYRIAEIYGLPVASLVLLADEHPNWRPRCFRRQLPHTMIEFSFGTAKLLDYAADIEALESSRNPIAWVTLVHWRSLQTHHDAGKRYAAKLHLTGLLFRHGWSKRRIIVLLNVVDWMMTLPAPYQRRYQKAILQLGKEPHMKPLLSPLWQMFVDDGIKIGLEKGLARGRQEGEELGRKKGAVAILERQLERRFGPLPQAAHKKLAKASMKQIEAWSDALVTAESLEQVFQ